MSPEATSAEGRHEFEVFVNDVKEVWPQKDVPASAMMEKAGVTQTKDLILEALDSRNGSPVAEFQPDQTVDLSLPDRKFFRITAGGGGFS